MTALEESEVGCRPAVPADLPRVAELLLASRAAAVPAMPPVPPGAEEHVRRDVGSWDLAWRETWLAETVADGGLVGFAVLAGDWLEALYVAPAAQRGGIGSMLLDVARARRAGGFCLWVFESNAPARSFYTGHGLLELERTDGSGNPEGVPDLRMVWPGAEPLAFLLRLLDEVDDELGDLQVRRAALTRALQAHRTAAPRDAARS